MDLLYKLFLMLYREKSIEPLKNPDKKYSILQGLLGTLPKNEFKLFTYDLVADPGGSSSLYANYIESQLKESKTYSEYLSEEIEKNKL